MSRELHIFNLRLLRDQYEAEHVDEIVETIDVAIWALQTQEQLMKERDAAMAQPEIIRCKDCKHYEADIMANPWGVCCHNGWVNGQSGHEVSENGWCYRAERRTDVKLDKGASR